MKASGDIFGQPELGISTVIFVSCQTRMRESENSGGNENSYDILIICSMRLVKISEYNEELLDVVMI